MWRPICLLLLGSWLTAPAQSPKELLNIHDYRASGEQSEQVSGSMVRHILQDRRGFMWFATTKGLIRYDGLNYQHYYHHPGQPHSLGGNSVKEIREATSGEIYLALNDAGLSRFNPKAPEQQAFINYSHSSDNPQSIPTNVLYALEIDQRGMVWMGGKNKNLIRFDPATQRFTTYALPASPTDDLDLSIYDLLADPDGCLWIGTSNSGLLRFWPQTRRFEQYTMRDKIPPGFKGRNATGSFFLDTKNQSFWFGSVPAGVCRLDKRTGRITSIRQISLSQIGSQQDYITDIRQDKSGAFWMVTVMKGLFRYDPIKEQFYEVQLMPALDPRLNNRFQFECFYLDHDDVIWVASNKGVVRYRAGTEQAVRQYPIQNSRGQNLTAARRVEQDQRGDCWLEFYDRMARYDTTRQQVVEVIPYPPALLRAGLSHLQVAGNQVFLHSYSGLYRFNPQSRIIEPLPLINNPQMRQHWQQAHYCRQILPDTLAGQPVLWLGIIDKKLLRYWVNTHQTETLPLTRGEWAVDMPESMKLDRQKTLWITTNGQGLFRIDDKQTGRFTHFRAQPSNPHWLPDNELTDLLCDHQGRLWLASLTHGLVRINGTGRKVWFTTYSEFPDGPPGRILSFFEDDRHLFWIQAGEGIFLFNPETGRFLKHAATEQLLFRPDREMITPAPDHQPLMVANRVILKGSDAGAAFSVPLNPPLHFTDFRVFNQSKPELLAKPGEPVRLSHEQSSFSISFTAPWFQHPEQIRYRYRLEGFDPGWIEADTRREAFYTNIPHGTYTFRVQASWDGTDQFTRTLSLPIVMTPAYWQMWWFRLAVLLVLVGITRAFWIYRQRETRLKSDLQLAEAENRQRETELREQDALFQRRLAETEMVALRSQMNPHFIFNCLNSVKLYTLQNDTDRAADYLTKFARLIRLVLENSRSERVTLANELEALQLYIELEAMRFKQKVRFEIAVDPSIDTQFMTIPPLLIQPYVENAIWHGLMHKPEGGTLRIAVQHPTDEQLQITITDDGVGRVRAAELKSKSANQNKSFGMKMTSERLSLINRHLDTQTRVTIHDLTTPDGQAAGTEVVLEIPV